jgi:hypothetical protein
VREGDHLLADVDETGDALTFAVVPVAEVVG